MSTDPTITPREAVHHPPYVGGRILLEAGDTVDVVEYDAEHVEVSRRRATVKHTKAAEGQSMWQTPLGVFLDGAGPATTPGDDSGRELADAFEDLDHLVRRVEADVKTIDLAFATRLARARMNVELALAVSASPTVTREAAIEARELAERRLAVIGAVEDELDARDARFTGDGTFADAVADRLGLAAPTPCPDGCGCCWRMDAERAECACGGPCCMPEDEHGAQLHPEWGDRPDPDDVTPSTTDTPEEARDGR